MNTIDYYFTSISPFTYLGNTKLYDIAANYGCTVAVRPVNLFALWEVSGAVPPAQRPPVRQRMRLVELQRMSILRDLPLNLKPQHFPVDPTLADSAIIAIIERGGDPRAFMDAVFTGIWCNEQNVSDPETLEQYLSSAGFDAKQVLDDAKSEKIADIRLANTNAAIEADVPGVPAYVMKGECFWGQDRLEFLENALKSGREPIVA